MDKDVTYIARQTGEILQISRIGQLVNVDHALV
jgi:hypothetical protein